MHRALPLAFLVLAGCAVAPEGTSLTRIVTSLHHVDHPEYVRVERAADFTGSHDRRVYSDAGRRHLEADADVCWGEASKPTDRTLSVGAHLRQYRETAWACLWAKGWRWERDRAPASPTVR